MNLLYLSQAAVVCYANDNDAFIPELWANEGLAILEENMVMAQLVHRDFENQIRDYGDVVNTRKPGTFQIRRKKDGDALENQNANATNVRVPLDQWFYNSFTINDGEASMSFQDLVDVYLLPGMQTIARSVDRALLGRVHAFLGGPTGRVGRLNNLNATNSKDYVLEARQILNTNKAYQNDRNLVLSPASETALLKTELFIKANERGDGGSALENAELGKILGFRTFLDQNVNSMATGADTDVTYAVNNSGGYAAGVATLTVDTGSNPVAVGEFVNFDGNDQPTYLIAGTDVSGACTSMVINENLKYAVLNDTVVTRYVACAVNGGYNADHTGKILVDGWNTGKAPQAGQMIAFGNSGSRRTYTIIESNLNTSGVQAIYLDRPLEIALVNDDAAYPGPTGSFNWAFHRDALALVSRPLALPNGRFGVMAQNGVHNNVTMRVGMQYDLKNGGTVVNLDMLCGVAVLDTALAVVLQG